ncbi:MAG: hypothetical protein IT363_06520 [Methanoregulaceae archaeon]|nr:hypothetical protein [Methanoregulaceae archaeon]
MSFAVRLAADMIASEAGSTTPLDLEVANQSDQTDQYELSIEGLDPEWTAVPVPVFAVSAHDLQGQKVFFKPPRTSESLAGNYPFVIRVRSLESGEVRLTQGVLEIRPYHSVSMEILPKKGVYGPWRRTNIFRATIINLGNCEETLQLFGSDPEDALAYDLPADQITIAPGQQREVAITVNPVQRRALSNPRLHGFQISARSVETPSVYCAAQAQLEHRPVVSPGNFMLFLIAVGLMVGWWAFRPMPPVLDAFQIDPAVVPPGGAVRLTWQSSHAKSVKVLFNDSVIVSQGAPRGTTTINVDRSGTFTAIAVRETRTSAPSIVSVTVKVPEVLPPPEVTAFEIKTREVAPGESFFVSYRVKDAIKATLSPSGQILDPKLESIQVEAPSQPGVVRYFIVAENAAGQTAKSRTINVNVAAKPEANIVVFRADPMEVDPLVGKCKISWQITGAVRAELVVDGQTLALETTEGEMTLDVTKTVPVVLIGYDANGLTVKKSATITLKAPIVRPDDSTTGNPGTGGLR